MTIARNFLGAAVSVLSLAGTAAYADTTPLNKSHLVVGYKDLDLDQPRDVARLFGRINSAADRVCGPRSFGGLPGKTAEYDSCFSDAIARAVARIDRPLVTAYFQQRGSDSEAHRLANAQQ
jgi:UrcA family protein